MPDRPKSISSPSTPPWNEADSIRETLLICIDNPADREAVRHVGRLLYDLAVETTRMSNGNSPTRDEMLAVAAELRYLQGFLAMVRRSATVSDLDPEDERLARYAGRLARKVGALAASVEGEL